MLHVRLTLLIAVMSAMVGVAVWRSPHFFYAPRDCAAAAVSAQASGEVGDYDLQNLASHAITYGDYHTALGLYTQLIHRHPTDGTRYITRGEVFFALGNYRCALADREMAMKLMPNNIQVRVHRAHVNYMLGRCSEAIDDGVYAVTHDPDNPNHTFLYELLGECFVKLGKYDEAIAFYETHMQSPDEWFELHRGLGLLHFQTGHYAEAIAEFTQVLEVKADEGYMLDLLTKSYVALGQIPEGIETFSGVIERIPDNLLALDLRGDLYFSIGEYEASIADYNRVIALDPDSAYAFLDRGRAYGGAGDFGAMMHNLEFAYRLEPVGIGGILCHMAEFFPDTHVQRKALSYFSAYIWAHPTRDFGYIGRSAIYLANKQYRLAARDLKPLVALFPDDAGYRVALEFALMGGYPSDEDDSQLVQSGTGSVSQHCQA